MQIGTQHLKALARFLDHVLIVSYLQDEIADFHAKILFELLGLGASVFHRIVKDRCGQHRRIAYPALLDQDARYFKRMIDIRGLVRILTLVIFVLDGSKSCRFQDQCNIANSER
jgi:hypothetical protein